MIAVGVRRLVLARGELDRLEGPGYAARRAELRRKAQEAARTRDRQAAAASQNEAEESDATEEEVTRERTTRVGRPRGGMKVAARSVSRALRGGRGKEEPLSAIATVLHAAPGDDGLPPPGPPRHTSAAQCLTARTREASPCAGYPAHGSACQPRIHASVVRAHGIQAFARQRRG